jgi:hypothetical protein
MRVTREEHQGRSGAKMFTNGGVAANNHRNGAKKVSMSKLSKWANPVLIAATAAAPTDRKVHEAECSSRSSWYPQRNSHAAPIQGCGQDFFWSEARMVHHPRCRRQRRSGAPGRELLEETA